MSEIIASGICLVSLKMFVWSTAYLSALINLQSLPSTISLSKTKEGIFGSCWQVIPVPLGKN